MHNKTKKYIAFFVLFFIIGGFVVGAMPQPAKAQWATLDIPTIAGNIWTALKDAWKKAEKQIIATAFKKSLSTFLNKLAYDSAVYVAAGGSGQKSLVNPFSKEALSNLGDAVAGGFIDELAQKSGFTGTPGQPGALGTTSLCEPVDLTAKANLLLSFKKPKEPPVPTCSLTAMKKNAQKVANDDLLTISAGAQVGETDIISATINGLITGGPVIKNDLNNYSRQLSDNIESYTSLAQAIINQPEDQKQAVADQSAAPLKNNEANISNILNQLNDIINNRASKCSSAIEKSIAGGCASAECSDFIFAFQCKENLTNSILLAANLVAVAAPALEDVRQLNKSIAARMFEPPTDVDPKDIGNAFSSGANPMGQFTEIDKAIKANQQKVIEAAKLEQVASGPCKGKKTTISEEVTTPASVPCKVLDSALEGSAKDKETFTGTIADAFGVFTNTLTAKLMEKYFKKGLSVIIGKDGVRKCDGPNGVCPDKTEDILRSGAAQGGKAEAEKAFGGLLTASIETGGQQDILSILASCPPEQPALNNCIIEEPFRRAIEKQYTVKEAMEAYKTSGGSEGLDPKKPFGYIMVGTSSMDEPDFKNGYPYRSMLYLRKYRIIPVGWELAAQYIKNAATLSTYTLEEVEVGFDNPVSPFFGLVDPAWALKSPTVFCARQGPGPELLSSELMCEKFDTASGSAQCMSDDYQARKVSRKEWCADEQTCLEEGENGDCKRYGYCSKEKNIWKLGGTQCEKNYASCDAYASSVTKANYTVLTDTLVMGNCNQSNVGCQWYCQEAPKMCIGGTRGGQLCGVNNDCSTIYCSVGTCSNNSSITCSFDTDCGGSNTCDTGIRRCVNGDRAGDNCAADPAICGNGVVDGVCEEGGVWSCKNTDTGTCSNNNANCTKLTENTACATASETGFCNIPNRINLDRDVKKCEAKDAGCNQFIKVLPGTNLIGNSGFEDDNSGATLSLPPGINGLLNQWNIGRSAGTVTASVDSTIIHSGKNSLKIVASGPNISALLMGVSTLPLPTPVGMVVPTGFSLDPDKTYTASAWVYVSGAALSSTVSLGFGNLSFNPPFGLWETGTTAQTSPQWERISATVTPEIMAQWGGRPNLIRIYLSAGSGDIYIDDLQLEEGLASNYAQYGSLNLAHLNGKRITCEESEIGCKLYSPASGGAGIPGVINEKDKCPAECSGYKQYRELPAFFTPSRGCEFASSTTCVDDSQCQPLFGQCLNDRDRAAFRNFIPSIASSCQASAVGCEEFTNLDTVASGGEAKEYYTRLRQCAKPGTTTEATYYTWEGSEEAGFQLRAWRFKSVDHDSNAATPMRPYVTDNDYDCADITNPDCRTFYDQTGMIYKEELSSTVFISNDCHPLRKTVQGTRAECAGSGGRTTTVGTGADDIVTCLYDAIPSQGIRCSAKEAGCREYRGPTASNLYTAFSDDFEDLTSQGWQPSYLSTEATTVGGRSYHLHSSGIGDPWTLKKSVADLVEQDKTYVLEFWAKWNTAEDASQNVPGNVPVVTRYMNARFFGTATSDISFPLRIDIGNSGEWNRYVIGPVNFSRSPAADENIEIFPAAANGAPCTPESSAGSSTCAGDYYIDNIVLREITDNPYLIKDSWKTPVSCVIDPEITKTYSNLPTTLSADIAADATSLTVSDSNGFDNPYGSLAIDGEIIEYDGLAGNVFSISTRGARKTSPAAHLATASIWPVDERAQLGCEQYKDSSGQTVYLRSFTNLCREDRVGCTEMFNTYNSRSIYQKTDKGEYIPRDRRELVVDNPKLYCDVSLKGCEKMGQPALDQNGAATSWGEAYLINDPDQYDKIACQSNETMCSEFVNSSGGTIYFKDPKDALCEYNSSINIEGTITKGWFKKGVVPAVLGDLTPYDSDGIGGPDSYAHLECMAKATPSDESKWTRSCPSDQAGCSEFESFGAVPQSFYSLKQGVDSASCNGVIDPLKGCVAFDDKSNPFKMVDSTVTGGNAFAPVCVKCSDKTVNNICNTSATCNPDKDNCCCDNGTVAAAAAMLPVRNICNANAILKVKYDRQCAEWLACRTSVEVIDSKGNKLKMCTSRQACASASDGEECDSAGWVTPDYTGPTGNRTNVADANLRSGYFKAGKTMGATTIQGYYSYSAMTQTINGRCSIATTVACSINTDCPSFMSNNETCVNPAIAFEDDFETYQSGELLPQCAVDAVRIKSCGDLASTINGTCEDNKKGICLDYWSSTAVGGAKATNKEFKFGGQSLLITESNSNASAILSKPLTTVRNTSYALTVWLNTKNLVNAANTLMVEVYQPGNNLTKATASQVQGNDWKKYISTFTTDDNANGNQIRVRIYVTNNAAGSKGYVDMISLAPVLQIQNPRDTRTLPSNYAITSDPAYVERSCRIYAKPDALTCNYRERNTGRQIQGLRGFCAEFDPKNPEYCLQWWPIDLISGEDISKF